jgi:SAM-dependent methyltransferase
MNRWLRLAALTASACCVAAWASTQGTQEDKHGKADAERMIQAAEGTLAPVYAPLAEEIVQRLDLADTQGLGIDLGSGPGTLIVELCKRTKLHWINADINPYFFSHFFVKATAAGYSGRVSAIQADACELPFRDNLVDVVVSRGSFQFWPDLRKGLSEIYRVLKPGGVAYIGRGLPESLPPETARRMRSEQGKDMKYDPAATAQQLREIVPSLGIKDYHIHRPRIDNPEGINYGLWLQFCKPKLDEGGAVKP